MRSFPPLPPTHPWASRPSSPCSFAAIHALCCAEGNPSVPLPPGSRRWNVVRSGLLLPPPPPSPPTFSTPSPLPTTTTLLPSATSPHFLPTPPPPPPLTRAPPLPSPLLALPTAHTLLPSRGRQRAHACTFTPPPLPRPPFSRQPEPTFLNSTFLNPASFSPRPSLVILSATAEALPISSAPLPPSLSPPLCPCCVGWLPHQTAVICRGIEHVAHGQHASGTLCPWMPVTHPPQTVIWILH